MGIRRVLAVFAIGLLAAALSAAAPAQDALTANLDASGMIQFMRGGVEMGLIELNAHGPNWQHAPQADATGDTTDIADGGKQVVGVLPVPNTDGASIEFTERVTPVPRGLRLEYDLNLTKAARLNGLQLSLVLPVGEYAGSEVSITRPDDEPQVLGLPEEQPERNFQLWRGDGSKVDIATGTDNAMTVELRAATDVVIQDLRQWEQPVFEVRFPAIMQEEGRDVAAEDRFHLDLTVTFASPVELREK